MRQIFLILTIKLTFKKLPLNEEMYYISVVFLQLIDNSTGHQLSSIPTPVGILVFSSTISNTLWYLPWNQKKMSELEKGNLQAKKNSNFLHLKKNTFIHCRGWIKIGIFNLFPLSMVFTFNWIIFSRFPYTERQSCNT